MIHLQTFESLDSTSDEARRQLESGRNTPFAIHANVQKKGRGSQGRHWVTQSGNLSISLVFKYSLQWAPSLQVGVLIAEWLKETMGLSIVLKWPNDLIVQGKKLGGILCEVCQVAGQQYLIVGVGLNIPKVCGVSSAFAHEATSLEELGYGDRLSLPQDLSLFLRYWEKRWEHIGLKEYLSWCVSVYQPYRLKQGVDVIQGVSEDGALLGSKAVYYGSQGMSWGFQKPAGGALVILKKEKTERMCFIFSDPWSSDFERKAIEDLGGPPWEGWPLYVDNDFQGDVQGGWKPVKIGFLEAETVLEIKNRILKECRDDEDARVIEI